MNPHRIRRTIPSMFESAFNAAMLDNPYAQHVTHFTCAELADARALLLTESQLSGIAVFSRGDSVVEGCALFRNDNAPRGAGMRMLAHAVVLEGVNYLECYGPALRNLYATLGFTVATCHPFDGGLASPQWDYERFGTPNYYTMRLP